jgi:hypothetical protein
MNHVHLVGWAFVPAEGKKELPKGDERLSPQLTPRATMMALTLS